MRNLILAPGMTIKAQDGFLTINFDKCMSYCDTFGSRALSFYMRNRHLTTEASREDRFQEQLTIIKDFLKGEKQVEIVRTMAQA